MNRSLQDSCQAAYDAVADEYAVRIADELRHKPLDCQLLDRFAATVRDVGPVCDLGCGPGHVARYLHERGVRISGVDLSARMIECARRLTPEIGFRQGDMLALTAADETFAGIVAFYSLIHIPRPELHRALLEMKRVLRPGGQLLIAFHLGDETIHLEEWWGHAVSIDFYMFQAAAITESLRMAGFQVEEVVERDPYPAVEHQSRRAYIFAIRPADLPS